MNMHQATQSRMPAGHDDDDDDDDDIFMIVHQLDQQYPKVPHVKSPLVLACWSSA
jgi:hypothetical protein